MPVRLVIRTFSELCITVGAVIVLFVVYVLYWTGVKAADASDGEIHRLQDQWSRGRIELPAPGATASAAPPAATQKPQKPQATRGAPTAPTTRSAPAAPAGTEPARRPARSTAPAARPPAYRDGKPFAVMYVPRFGRAWDWPVLEGTGVNTLKKGLGHYPGTAALGGRGNFAVAGHRRTYGDPFKDVPLLRPGDAVVLTDGASWFTYRVDRRAYRTVPTDIGVIDPVPEKSGFRVPGRYLTLTTCEPEWGSSHRLIVWARLEATRPVTDGKPPALRS
ncbi:class E sortase [Streptomyces jumonjinensis]|uniref:class E sortase n=1 Tax=Streptomyces jumonjinensis TaxID=1945 RepID=UPI0037931F6E